MKLKQYLLATALCLAPLAASAADLPRKAAPYYPPPPPPFSWTGFYFGGSVGVIGQDVQATDVGGLFFGAGDTYSNSSIGFIGGGNIGYNYQFAGNWVVGIEADISGTSLSRGNAFDCCAFATINSKLNALGTVRARLGYAFDRALLYATGGWAYGRVEDSANFGGPFVSSNDEWRNGWTVGGGLEYAVLPNWTVRAEALYVDLGTSNGSEVSGCRFSFKHHYAIGRLGVNYKF